MFTPDPRGGDGTSANDVLFRLGELYSLTVLSQQLSSDLAIPQRCYGIVQAYETSPSTTVIIQLLPDLERTIRLQLNVIQQMYMDGLMTIDHHPVSYRHNSYEIINYNLKITQEHSELVSQNLELLTEWKLLCLYEQPDVRVKLTYGWLTQSD